MTTKNKIKSASIVRIAVTGGLGFIGSHFIQLLLDKGYHVINIDKRTYAARKDLSFEKYSNYELIEEDICLLKHLPSNISHIVSFAAESHVDNSILANTIFFESNTRGVYNILELIRSKDTSDRPTLIYISTDEVYGDILNGSSKETDILNPSNPYSATKAAAEQLVNGWERTYGLKVRVCRSSNNYGFGQYPEKLIPKTVNLVSRDIKMTIHGTGLYQREWTYVGDNCEAILLVMEKGKDGEIYNISSGEMFTNLDIVKLIISHMNKPANFYEFVENRIGQDVRYSLDTTKTKKLGWKPKTDFKKYLPEYLKLMGF